MCEPVVERLSTGRTRLQDPTGDDPKNRRGAMPDGWHERLARAAGPLYVFSRRRLRQGCGAGFQRAGSGGILPPVLSRTCGEAEPETRGRDGP